MVSFASKRSGALALLLLADIAFRLYYYWLTLPLLASNDHREWVREETSATTAPHTAECPPVPPAVGELTDMMMRAPLGWSHAPPGWVSELCPQVVEHFDHFPHLQNLVPFSKDDNNETIFFPWFTTHYHARGVCTLHILQSFAEHNDVEMLLYAGSHLGAVGHGQPLPWDDDIDVIVSVSEWIVLREILFSRDDGASHKDRHGNRCRLIHNDTNAELCARVNYNVLKVLLSPINTPQRLTSA